VTCVKSLQSNKLLHLTILKRRDVKKQIRRLELELLPLVMKYLEANQRVHPVVLAKYENEIERILYYLVEDHLRLDRSWPWRERWFDGLEEFVWEKSPSILSGSGELWWGYLANISGAQIKEHCCVTLNTKKQKKLVYQIVVGKDEGSRTFSNCS
jgi:hypothetical protein